MAYKIKGTKEIPRGYWSEQEVARLRKKYKGKMPPAMEITRVGTRKIFGIEPRVHKKGAIVEYKEGIARVKRVSKKGLYLQIYHKPDDKNLAYPNEKKVVFVPEKRVEHEVYPFFINFPIWSNPFFVVR